MDRGQVERVSVRLLCSLAALKGERQMCEFNTIILSRKGFDSSAGGGFSPFDTETRKYILLPIPEEDEMAIKDTEKFNVKPRLKFGGPKCR